MEEGSVLMDDSLSCNWIKLPRFPISSGRVNNFRVCERFNLSRLLSRPIEGGSDVIFERHKSNSISPVSSPISSGISVVLSGRKNFFKCLNWPIHGGIFSQNRRLSVSRASKRRTDFGRSPQKGGMFNLQTLRLFLSHLPMIALLLWTRGEIIRRLLFSICNWTKPSITSKSAQSISNGSSIGTNAFSSVLKSCRTMITTRSFRSAVSIVSNRGCSIVSAAISLQKESTKGSLYWLGEHPDIEYQIVWSLRCATKKLWIMSLFLLGR